MYRIKVQKVRKNKRDGKTYFEAIDSYVITECGDIDAYSAELVGIAQSRFKGCSNVLTSVNVDGEDVTATFQAKITI